MTAIIEALRSLRPGAIWSIHGDTYAGLEWLDEVQSKPTEKEIGDEITRLSSLKVTEEQRLSAVKSDADFSLIMDRLKSMTPTQWKTMTDGISDLAQARTMFYRMGLVLMMLARRIDQ